MNSIPPLLWTTKSVLYSEDRFYQLNWESFTGSKVNQTSNKPPQFYLVRKTQVPRNNVIQNVIYKPNRFAVAEHQNWLLRVVGSFKWTTRPNLWNLSENVLCITQRSAITWPSSQIPALISNGLLKDKWSFGYKLNGVEDCDVTVMLPIWFLKWLTAAFFINI